MSDSERIMSEDDDEQYQSENSSMEDENPNATYNNQKQLIIQKVQSK